MQLRVTQKCQTKVTQPKSPDLFSFLFRALDQREPGISPRVVVAGVDLTLLKRDEPSGMPPLCMSALSHNLLGLRSRMDPISGLTILAFNIRESGAVGRASQGA